MRLANSICFELTSSLWPWHDHFLLSISRSSAKYVATSILHTKRKNMYLLLCLYDKKNKTKIFLCCISRLLSTYYLGYIILLLLLHINYLYLEYLFYAAGRWAPNMINTFRLRKYSERPPNNLTPWGFTLQISAHFLIG